MADLYRPKDRGTLPRLPHPAPWRGAAAGESASVGAIFTAPVVSPVAPPAMSRRLLSVAAFVVLTSAVSHAQTAPANTLTAAERKAGWTLLFDGTSLAAWRGYQQADLPPEWTAINGTMTKVKTTNDIVTREQFGDFELSLEWKLPLRGNSGIFYRATEKETKVYWSAPEYQLAEDSLTPDSRNLMTSVAAVYGFYPSKRGVVHAAGEWNHTRIVAKGPHVEHWLNGTLIAQYELWSPEWVRILRGDPNDPGKKPLKFAPYTEFGMAKRGHIAIQGDHNGELSMRNIKIRALK